MYTCGLLRRHNLQRLLCVVCTHIYLFLALHLEPRHSVLVFLETCKHIRTYSRAYMLPFVYVCACVCVYVCVHVCVCVCVC